MPHLLLVDDEEALRSVVAERLTDEGFEVIEAADGEAALKALDGFAFDVIVSDLRLPGVDGARRSSTPPSTAIPASSRSSSPATAP